MAKPSNKYQRNKQGQFVSEHGHPIDEIGTPAMGKTISEEPKKKSFLSMSDEEFLKQYQG